MTVLNKQFSSFLGLQYSTGLQNGKYTLQGLTTPTLNRNKIIWEAGRGQIFQNSPWPTR